ncbi:MAG: c-type cytochrome [Candidatus Thiodiazotropha sp. (ex Epidulcina cf. delphinae)]|nr:c-type cytochrome [Candidatus Thiodiazotropha sp. (ex Epidulcina cf. delphinae)]
MITIIGCVKGVAHRNHLILNSEGIRLIVLKKLTLSRFSTLFFLTCCLWSTAWAGWNEAESEREEAMNLTPDIVRGKTIYEGCGVCHMPEGWGTPNGAYPQIAGQHRSVVIKQLADIRAENRDNPSMYPFAIPEEIGGAQSIADVALYIESLKMTTATGKGDGNDLEHGKKFFIKYCTECHGEHGEGSQAEAYPVIQGQHYNYLLRQLMWIQNGKRRNANQDMMEAISDFSMRDLKALSDYVSRLPLDENKRSPYTWKNRIKAKR